MYKGKNVLVAGTGTIAIPLVKELLRRGAKVKVVSIETEKNVREKLGMSINFDRLDLTQEADCQKAVREQEFVFNLVGIRELHRIIDPIGIIDPIMSSTQMLKKYLE